LFTYRLVLEDGTPAEPPTFVSSRPDWHEGDKLLIRPGLEYRIVEARSAEDVSGVWVVQRV